MKLTHKNVIQLILVGSLLIFQACSEPEKIYTYSDGSGNQYVITTDSIEYIPVKPEFSSSGFYDGGEGEIKELESLERVELIDLFEQAVEKYKKSEAKREMGSGQINISKGKSSQSCILKFGSKDQREIETSLRKIVMD